MNFFSFPVKTDSSKSNSSYNKYIPLNHIFRTTIHNITKKPLPTLTTALTAHLALILTLCQQFTKTTHFSV